jgi:hypothetical protein
LHPFLQELNPILSFANFNQQVLAGFVTNGSLAFNLDLDSGEPEDGVFDYVLQQYGVINATGLQLNTTRPSYDIGNAYIAPNNYKRGISKLGAPEAFDCKTRGGEQKDPDPDAKLTPCFVQPPSLWDNKLYPLVQSGESPNIPAPQGTEGRKSSDPAER